MDAFVRLKAFGMDPMDGTLQSLVDTGSKFAMSQADILEVARQLGQAYQNNALLAEDIRPLINRGIPVYELLAKAMGKTTTEIIAMRKEGKLGADAVTLLIDAMGKDSAGAAERNMKSWSGMWSNMQDVFLNFKRSIADAGLFDFVKGELASLMEWFDRAKADGSLQELAKTISKELVGALKALKEIVVNIDWGATWQGMKEAAKFAEKAFHAIGGLKGVMVALGVVVAGPLIASIGSLGLALWALGAASLPITGALLGIIAAGAAVAANWDGTVLGTAKNIWEELTNGFAALSQSIRESLKDTWAGDIWESAIAGVSMLIEGVMNAVEPLRKAWDELWKGVVKAIEWAKSKIAPILDWIAEKVRGLTSTLNSISNFSRGIGRAVGGFFGGGDSEGTTQQAAPAGDDLSQAGGGSKLFGSSDQVAMRQQPLEGHIKLELPKELRVREMRAAKGLDLDVATGTAMAS